METILKELKNNPHRGRYLAPPSGTPYGICGANSLIQHLALLRGWVFICLCFCAAYKIILFCPVCPWPSASIETKPKLQVKKQRPSILSRCVSSVVSLISCRWSPDLAVPSVVKPLTGLYGLLAVGPSTTEVLQPYFETDDGQTIELLIAKEAKRRQERHRSHPVRNEF